jgi:hypothetical protein
MPQWIGDFYQLFLMGSRNNDELLVSHILFAEDTFIFFCEANHEQLCHLHCLFLCFEVVSGL